MPRTEALYFQDIIEAADLISDYVAGLTIETFQRSRLVQDSVLYRLLIIGEAVAHISASTRRRYPQIEWPDIVAFRNFAVHGYFALDLSIAWNAATKNVPVPRREIESILAQEGPTESTCLDRSTRSRRPRRLEHEPQETLAGTGYPGRGWPISCVCAGTGR
jgi:uncharacterized protein with HEPN domain